MAQIGTIARFEVSGEILNEDVLALLAARDAGVPGADMDKVEEGDFYAAWDLLRDQWQAIRSEVAEFDTERLRRRWIMPLLEILGHSPQFLKSHPTLPSGASIPITHRTDTIPIWLADFVEKPDDRPTEGKRRRSKHELFQEYLDMTEDDWGILCTGRTIRLLTDYHKTLTRNFVEADLESIFDELDLDAFRIVWRLFRASAFLPKVNRVRDIERIRDHSRQQGTEIGKELRKQVVRAVVTLANGFLQADDAGTLRHAVETDPEGPALLYKAVLRIVYRLLFMLYVENKPGWTPAQDPRWASGYSVSRLRVLAEDQGSFRAEGEDLWEGLKVTFRVIRDGCLLFNEPISPYGGEIFDDERLWLLKDSPLTNGNLLEALYLLTIFERKEKKTTTVHRVNFRNLRIEALGSVYEALLEIAPIIGEDGTFGFGEGTERKLSGSYYTPQALVDEIVKSALLPVIEARLEGVPESAQETALLAITVVDPACGSGHFLVEAMNVLAARLCDIRKAGESPTDLEVRNARRDVVAYCIHGVDLNPMAVELCRFILWLHVAHPEFPLSYLEPVIRQGNGIIGVPTKRQVEEIKARIREGQETLRKAGKFAEAKKLEYVGWPDAVPDDAFKKIEGDDAATVSAVRVRNRAERSGVRSLPLGPAAEFEAQRTTTYRQMKEITEGKIADQQRKKAMYAAYQSSGAYQTVKREADLWCSAFFWPMVPGAIEPPTHACFHLLRQIHRREYTLDHNLPETLAEANRISELLSFFQWELEFPDVFQAGGFDCVLGNPPWEKVKVEEREFFASRAPLIAATKDKKRRAEMIRALEIEDPSLFRDFEDAKYAAKADSRFFALSGRYPLTARREINVYAIFTEAAFNLIRDDGRVGTIVPSGIVTDETGKFFFGELTRRQSVELVLMFDYRSRAFPGVNKHFCLLGFSRLGSDPHGAFTLGSEFIDPTELNNPARRVRITAEQVRRVNPNTFTCPVLRCQADADILYSIYDRVGVLLPHGGSGGPWHIYEGRFDRMFDMTNDRDKHFHTWPELSLEGGHVEGNHVVVQGKRFLPLYEGKMLHIYNPRWATYGLDGADNEDAIRDVTDTELRSPEFCVLPRYWVLADTVESRTAPGLRWQIGIREITNTTNERTTICSPLPAVAFGNKVPLVRMPGLQPLLRLCWLALASSLALDFVSRQKLGALTYNQFYLKQLPFPHPKRFLEASSWTGPLQLAQWIGSRVLELSYTTVDLAPMAQDVGFHGLPFKWDRERRLKLREELDAACFLLYGITTDEAKYIMYETFPLLRQNDEALNGGQFLYGQGVVQLMERYLKGDPVDYWLDRPAADGWLPEPLPCIGTSFVDTTRDVVGNRGMTMLDFGGDVI